ncbi:ATP-binding cassette domain-containing protein, partial [Desulfuromonas acetoxidans]
LYIFRDKVVFDSVSFSYDSISSVFDDFQMTIVKGESVGIMGPSGCGKSTFVDLFCGLLIPDSGSILVDGQILDKQSAPFWRKKLGYVPQSPYIFDGTLAENIAFGVPDTKIDMQKIEHCCQRAAIDFLEWLPHGVKTVIGERGIRLSGGQRQRIAIARALYREPEIIIFDEATSALDEKKDNEIKDLIRGLKTSATLIVVSHRPSTVSELDRVVFF